MTRVAPRAQARPARRAGALPLSEAASIHPVASCGRRQRVPVLDPLHRRSDAASHARAARRPFAQTPRIVRERIKTSAIRLDFRASPRNGGLVVARRVRAAAWASAPAGRRSGAHLILRQIARRRCRCRSSGCRSSRGHGRCPRSRLGVGVAHDPHGRARGEDAPNSRCVTSRPRACLQRRCNSPGAHDAVRRRRSRHPHYAYATSRKRLR